MSKSFQIKTEIEQILLNPPPTKNMLQELRLNNVLVRRRAGNIELFAAINHNLIEKVWKAFKMQTLLEKNSEELKKIGLNPQTIIENQNLLANSFGHFLNQPHQNLIEGYAKDGTLELEVFRYDDSKQN